MAIGNKKIEAYVDVVKSNQGIKTAYDVYTTANLRVDGTLTTGNQVTGAQVITSASANALAVGPNGATNPSLVVDASTASAATGIKVKSAAAAGGVALSTVSSGTNENLTIDAKGSGTVTINGTASGIVVLPAGTTIGGSVPLTSTITSASSTAFQVGPNGATNPTFLVNTATASAANGLSVVSSAAGSGVALTVISSNATEGLQLNTKGGASVQSNTRLTVASGASNALAVGPNGTTNASFTVNTVAASAATGIIVTAAAAGSGIAIGTTSSGTNENLTIASKGTGTVTINPSVVATAGGAANDGVMFGSIGVGLFTGTGAPTFSAMNGSIYVDSNATTTTTRIYVNKSGAGTAGTTWTNLTTAA